MQINKNSWHYKYNNSFWKGPDGKNAYLENCKTSCGYVFLTIMALLLSPILLGITVFFGIGFLLVMTLLAGCVLYILPIVGSDMYMLFKFLHFLNLGITTNLESFDQLSALPLGTSLSLLAIGLIGGLLFFGSVVGSVLGASYLVDKSGGKITAWTKEKGFCKDISFSE